MSRLTILGKIAGAIIIVFGLHTMGVFRIEWLYQDKRVQIQPPPCRLRRSDARRHCVRVRMDAVHRTDSGRHSRHRRGAGHGRRRRPPAAGLFSRPWCPVLRDRAGDQPLLRGLCQDPPLLPHDRTGVGRAAGHHRRADLHEPFHDHRAVAHALSTRLLITSALYADVTLTIPDRNLVVVHVNG